MMFRIFVRRLILDLAKGLYRSDIKHVVKSRNQLAKEIEDLEKCVLRAREMATGTAATNALHSHSIINPDEYLN
jgi:hypothetical protein